MTRDEAVAAVIKSKEQWGGGSSELWLVNALQSLGVLKLDEPPNADEKLAQALSWAFSFDTGVKEMNMFREMLNKSGLKIVEK